MVNLENLDIQVNLENQVTQVTLAHQENLAVQGNLVKMVLTEINAIVLSVLEAMQQMEILVIKENEDNVDLLDLEGHLENLVMMPTAILENKAKMVNMEDLDNLERMVHQENPAMMVDLEMILN